MKITSRKMEYMRLEIEGPIAELEKFKKWAPKHYPGIKVVLSEDKESFHAILKTDEKRLAETVTHE